MGLGARGPKSSDYLLRQIVKFFPRCADGVLWPLCFLGAHELRSAIKAKNFLPMVRNFCEQELTARGRTILPQAGL